MPWLSLRVEVERSAADALGDALIEAGAQSVTIEWPDSATNVVHALFAEHADPDRALRDAVQASGMAIRASMGVERLADEDWVRRSQAQFAPFRAGRLWIGAHWHQAPDDASAIVRIDPGMAFGTGSHQSTRLVLNYLERTVRGGERVLDYGCGSGILAIAAIKLGAGPTDAVDVDPLSVEVTLANAKANAVDLQASLPEALERGRYDLVVANILAQPLIELVPVLSARARAGARLALSGILDSQAGEVATAYAPTFHMVIGAREEGWALLEGVRR